MRNVVVRAGNGVVVLRWRNPQDKDFRRVEIHRSRAVQPFEGPVVYKGKKRVFRDRNVKNGVQYRYTIKSVDEAGNQRRPKTKFATPHRTLLLRPRDEARVSKRKPPLLKWVKRPRARYYNVQLYRMISGAPVKVLSKWPNARKYKLRKTWVSEGRRYKLDRGRYLWYVWPGYGPRSANNYGRKWDRARSGWSRRA